MKFRSSAKLRQEKIPRFSLVLPFFYPPPHKTRNIKQTFDIKVCDVFHFYCETSELEKLLRIHTAKELKKDALRRAKLAIDWHRLRECISQFIGCTLLQASGKNLERHSLVWRAVVFVHKVFHGRLIQNLYVCFQELGNVNPGFQIDITDGKGVISNNGVKLTSGKPPVASKDTVQV